MKKAALDIIKQIMTEVEDAPPTQDVMRSEVQMMGFKIRQITGDADTLSQLDNKVIKSLWKIGKIDQIISDSFDYLDEDDQDRLLDYLHAVEMTTEQHLQQSIKTKKIPGKKSQVLKLEVFKNFDDSLVN